MNRQERAKLERAVKAGNKARQILDEDRRQKEEKKLKKLIGSCWKFNNGYNREDRWWLYLKITRVEDTSLYGFSFQKTTLGKIEIDADDCFISLDGGYLPIKPEEFSEAWLELKAELETLG